MNKVDVIFQNKVKTLFPLSKVFGRFHRFPAQSLSVSGSFCVICIENMLHSP